MRKNEKQFIYLNCCGCGTLFEKELKEHTRQIKGGNSRFYCSRNCFNSTTKTDEFTNFKYYFCTTFRNAKKRGISYSLTLEDLKSIWDSQKGICPYTGIPMKISSIDKKQFVPEFASLDRIDSSKGYELENVEFVCLFINYGKNGFSKEAIQDFIRKIQP